MSSGNLRKISLDRKGLAPQITAGPTMFDLLVAGAKYGSRTPLILFDLHLRTLA
jgi:hypothetical protein